MDKIDCIVIIGTAIFMGLNLDLLNQLWSAPTIAETTKIFFAGLIYFILWWTTIKREMDLDLEKRGLK